MYIATFLPKHVIPTCFADYVTSTSGAIRLAFDLSPWPQVVYVSLFSPYICCISQDCVQSPETSIPRDFRFASYQVRQVREESDQGK